MAKKETDKAKKKKERTSTYTYLLVVIIIVLLAGGGGYYYFAYRTDVPAWEVGDTWVYHLHEEVGTANETTQVTGLYVEEVAQYQNRTLYALQSFRHEEYRLIDARTLNPVASNGTIVHERYAFPLHMGKEWTIERSEEVIYRCQVEAKVTVTVPAGTYDAFKIVEEPQRSLAGATQTYLEGVYTHILYYAPEVKNTVKEEWALDGAVKRELELTDHYNDEWKRLVSSTPAEDEPSTSIEEWEYRWLDLDALDMSAWKTFQSIRFEHEGETLSRGVQAYDLAAMQWLHAHASSDSGVVCWWDQGSSVAALTHCTPVVASPSPSMNDTLSRPWMYPPSIRVDETRMRDVARALMGPPGTAHEVLDHYDASYILVDSYMFPFSAANTGIYYAPLTLLESERSEHISSLATTNRGWMSLERAREEVRTDPSLVVYDTVIDYQPAFYNSTFYRSYIGYSGYDLGLGDQGVPLLNPDGAFLDNRATFQPMPGWMQPNLRAVYITTYWNPHGQAELAANPSYAEEWTPIGSSTGSISSSRRSEVQIKLPRFIGHTKAYEGVRVRGRGGSTRMRLARCNPAA